MTTFSIIWISFFSGVFVCAVISYFIIKFIQDKFTIKIIELIEEFRKDLIIDDNEFIQNTIEGICSEFLNNQTK